MDFDFTSTSLAKLSRKERMAKCQQLAAEAEKSGHLFIAKQWRDLAGEAEDSQTETGEVAKFRPQGLS